MGVKGCCKLVKCFTIVWNICLWLIGSLFVGVGVWSLVDLNVVNYLDGLDLEDVADSRYLVSIFAIVIIVSGCLLLMLGIIGCIGAIKESVVLLITFSVFIFVVFGAVLALSIIAWIFRSKAQSSIEQQLKEGLDRAEKSNSGKPPGYVSAIEAALVCCGARGRQDYETRKIPVSVDCTNAQSAYAKDQPVPGCASLLQDTLFWVPMAVAVLAGLILVGLLCAVCLCCAVKNDEDSHF